LEIPNIKYDQSKRIIYELLIQNKLILLENLSASPLEPTSKESLRLIINNIDALSLDQSSPRNSEEEFEVINFDKKPAKSTFNSPPPNARSLNRFEFKFKPPDFSFSSLLKRKKDRLINPNPPSTTKFPLLNRTPAELKSPDSHQIPKILPSIFVSLQDDYVEQAPHQLNKSNTPIIPSSEPLPIQSQGEQLVLAKSLENDLNRSRRYAMVKNRGPEKALSNGLMYKSKSEGIIPGEQIRAEGYVARKENMKNRKDRFNVKQTEEQFYIEMNGSQFNAHLN